MKKITLLSFLLSSFIGIAQSTTTVLTANGPGNTYEDINAVLAPDGGDVIESPGIVPNGCTNHADFDNGETTNSNRHIQEVFDNVLNKNVFKFTLHVDEDIDRDRCSSDDRQRNEIKTYAPSPDYLKAVEGETVEYRWKFKLPTGFQASSSFTHLHQLKSVGGIEDEEDSPMITLTAYSSGNGRLVLRYSGFDSQTTLNDTAVALSDLEDNWVEVIERVTYGFENEGFYSITITDIDTGEVFMNYSDTANRYYKTDADFIRPKWGIYRSLNDPASLRDEEVLFADFEIIEIDNSTLSNVSFEKLKKLNIYPNPVKNVLNFPLTNQEAGDYSLEITSTLGTKILSIKLSENNINVANLTAGVYFLKLTDISSEKSIIKKLIKI